MTYLSNPVGNEISCVMYKISNETLKNHKKLESTLIKALKQDKFRILGKISHEFQPQRYTLTVLLSESHVAIHTYPKYNSLFFYLYSCRGPKDGRKTYEFLKEKLKPSSIKFNERPIIVKKE
jgi:S-adenosylmethionine decarboxylase proenzyme